MTPASVHDASTATCSRTCWLRPLGLLVLPLMVLAGAAHAADEEFLSDEPLLGTKNVPGNVALALSVEFPTAVSVAHIEDTYVPTTSYIGYFDPKKCYRYVTSVNERARHFTPDGIAGANSACANNRFSGNFMNWATTQTIDPFRQVLTGGFRFVDTETETILQKATADGQGGLGNFPNRVVAGAGSANATGGTVGDPGIRVRIQGLGHKMRFTRDTAGAQNRLNNNASAVTEFNGAQNLTNDDVLEVSVRVKVCDAASPEANCVRYSGGFKPEGLLQKFSKNIRVSALGYLNDSNVQRDGGVLRARQKFLGPKEPKIGAADVDNPLTEWNPITGVLLPNPSPDDRADTPAAFINPNAAPKSGVINYLNGFGQRAEFTVGTTLTYKSKDPVGELYYTALRYFKKQGSVESYTSTAGLSAAQAQLAGDEFPVIPFSANQTKDDPILFSCQKNFIIGIGDVNTHADRNLPGVNNQGGFEPAKPGEVIADETRPGSPMNAVSFTNEVGALEGINNLGNQTNFGGCCSENGPLIAGLAYDAHTRDIRPDLPNGTLPDGRPDPFGQTVQTFWMDVLEFQGFKANNQYVLATRYGAFDKKGFSRNQPVVSKESWNKDKQTFRGRRSTRGGAPANEFVRDANGPNTFDLPDSYFIADAPKQVQDGLTRAFNKIASELSAFSGSFSSAQPQVVTTGTTSFSTSFNWGTREGEVEARELTFNAQGRPTLSATPAWKFSEKLKAQAAANRRAIVTFDPTPASGLTGTGVPFQLNRLNAAQVASLDTPIGVNSNAEGDTNDAGLYLRWLRGDQTHEQNSQVANSLRQYRTRTNLVGDIVGSRAVVVPPPNAPLSDSTNPGYSQFRTSGANRPTMVYVGANDGMLHAINGSTGAAGGSEHFAYVPSALFEGPDGRRTENGLAAIGNPAFTGVGEYFFVNASPRALDLDFNRTGGASGAPDWRSILIGGLGKGGRSYYAIDITTPQAMDGSGNNSAAVEGTVAGKVLWELNNNNDARLQGRLGFSFGQPIVVKTRRDGWVAIVTSGYDNSDGKGYIFFVNPRTGAVIDRVDTNVGSLDRQAGLAHATAFVVDRTDGTADALYAGDLLGNVWRVDLRGDAYTIKKIGELTDSAGNPQPVTTRPLVEVQPGTNKRFVMIGTGQLLGETDLGSTRVQSFYSIQDGTNAVFDANLTIKRRADLALNTNLLEGVEVTANSSGWLIDFNDRETPAGSRVIVDAAPFFGRVLFTTVLPNNNPCEPAGGSRAFVLDFGSGRTEALENGVRVASVPVGNGNVVATENGFFSVTDPTTGATTPAALVGGGNTAQGIDMTPLQPPGLQRLNWREVPQLQ